MKNLLKVGIALAAVTCVASIHAFPTLTISASTGGSVTVNDGAANDKCAAVGCVTFIGAVGVWTLNVDTGLSKPVSGSASTPELDLSYLTSTKSTKASTLTITWSDSGFSGTFSASDFLGGTQSSGMSVTDLLQVNGVTVLTLGPFTTGSYTGTASTSSFLTLTPSDVVSLVIEIHKPARRGSVSFTASGDKNALFTPVPDSGSAVALLGIALTGIEVGRRLLRTRKA